MAHIGHPVLGDKAYGDRGENSFAKREYGITHQLLHARSVTFLHPITKKELHVEAPYDREMEMILL
jgi:23S rRNA-/tRNA-specific pseudouridylate synthase